MALNGEPPFKTFLRATCIVKSDLKSPKTAGRSIHGYAVVKSIVDDESAGLNAERTEPYVAGRQFGLKGTVCF